MNKLKFWKENEEEIALIIREINATSDPELDKFLLKKIDIIACKTKYNISMDDLKKEVEKINTNLIKLEYTNYDEEYNDLDYNDSSLLENISLQDEKEVDPLRQYIREISRYNLLTSDEEYNLFKRYKDGEKFLRDSIYNANLRLVVKIASRYANSNEQLLDMIQEGNIGMLTAIEKFDPDLGYKFSTYATHWIRQAIERSIPDYVNPYHIPDYINISINKVRRATVNLFQELGREPTVEEISSLAGVDIEEVRLIIKRSQKPTSIYLNISDDEEEKLVDFIPDGKGNTTEDNALLVALHKELLNDMKVLSDKEKDVVIKYYGLDNGIPKTLEVIAIEHGITKEGVRHIRDKAIFKLRGRAKKKKLDAYL